MATAIEFFNKNRWVYLNDTIAKADCEVLTDHLFDLHKKGLTEKDKQCPLSDSIYGDETLDKICQELAVPLGNQLGVKLLPTYTYARIYRTGEVLERHSDRPSCEISGTMTLGFAENSQIWPINFAKDEDDLLGERVQIGVGDLVMYRGCELPHWRPKYKGEWQVQVFFHFVDANGPHKDFVYDGRPKMGIKKGNVAAGGKKSFLDPEITDVNVKEQQELQQQINIDVQKYALPLSNSIYGGVMIRTCDNLFPGFINYNSDFRPETCFTPEECAKIVATASSIYGEKSTVGSDSHRAYRPETREVETYGIDLNPDTAWIFDRISGAVATANAEYYRFNLLGITHSLQLLHYNGDDQSHYDWHIDAGPESSATRKISLSIPLTPEEDYDGGVLEVNSNGVLMQASKEQGSIGMFPSFCLHRVTPVTRGERWVIVIWINGPDRFK
jgi:PKHD-type hydroxylase